MKYHNFPIRRRIKSFDPTSLVKNYTVASPVVTDSYVVKNSFTGFTFQPQLLNNVQNRGYLTPTPIQDQCIPALLAGKDIVGLANTGTGKTAAFLLPFIQKIVSDKSQKLLIVAPTRELAGQIEQEFRLFTRSINIYSALCIGGVGMVSQIRNLSRNPNLVVGTPGRLMDLEKRRNINFSQYNNVVLDEVDRILDMGFIRDITYIVSHLSPNRQSAFFSATIPDGVKRIMNSFLKNPITISVKSSDHLDNVSQDIVKTFGKPKINVLHDLLIQKGFDKVLVFGRTKWGLEKLAKDLMVRGFRVLAIHGNKSQSQRQHSLDQFKNNRVKVLLATDVASRGLDIDSITHVINYDLPESYEDYIHRIGRTGRADKKGVALTLVD